jgi:FkbM family methyltransferase
MANPTGTGAPCSAVDGVNKQTPLSQVTQSAPDQVLSTPMFSAALQAPNVPQAPPPIFSLAKLLREDPTAESLRDGASLPRMRVVDVGAMFLNEAEDVWGPLRRLDLCESIVGFEPCAEECDKLNQLNHTGGGSECSMRFLPHALGDGSIGEFRLCSAPMTSSMLEPNIPLLRRFVQLEEVTTVVKRSEMQTRRLDDLLSDMGGRVDFLKLDVQGYELAVLKGATTALHDVLVVHTEVEFVEMYEGQPLFAEVDQFLRGAGFVFHRFASVHGRPVKPIHFVDNPLKPISQQLWADAVYVRDLWELKGFSTSQLLRTALILHEVYHSYDIAHHVLAKADAGFAQRYLETVLGGVNSAAS